jgi:hypothetical protein
MTMGRGTLLPDTAEVELGLLRPKDGAIQMHLRACRASAVCPECQTISWRVHSRYARKLGDLPWEGIPVRIFLQARKFFCGREDCRRRIFTERLPNTVLRYGRRTRRAHPKRWIGSHWLWAARRDRGWHAVWVCWPMAPCCCGNCDEDRAPPRHRRLRAFLASTIGPGARATGTAPFCATLSRTVSSISCPTGRARP